MSKTYHSLAGGSLTQNWSNSALITTDDDWSNVPSIEGFLGQDITTSPGADPRTLLTDSAVANDLDVIASQTNPDTLVPGGVAEFDSIANPMIALSGSETADAPHLVIYLDTTGVQDVRVRYTVRDIEASTDNAIAPLAFQYRIGESGPWTDVPAEFIADTTDGGAAGWTSFVDVALPSSVNNHSQVQLRIITADAVGSDEWIGIDDIIVSAAPAGPTTIQNDQIDAVEGVELDVDAAHGVLANDIAPGTIEVREDLFRTANGGQVYFRSDGSYDYISAAGFSGTDSVQYTVVNLANEVVGTGKLTINVEATAHLPFVSVGSQLSERHVVESGFGQIGNGIATQASTPVVLSGGGYVVVLNYLDQANGSIQRVQTYDADHNLIGTFDPGFRTVGARIAALPDGGYALSYGVRTQSDPNDFSTLQQASYVQLFDAAGHSLSGPTQVDVPGSFDSISGLSALPNGGFVLLQTGTTGSPSSITQLYAQSFSAAGVPEDQLYTIGAPDQWRNPTILPNGEIVLSRVTGSNSDEPHLQRFDLHGNPIGGEIDLPSDGHGVPTPRTFALPDGGFVAMWMSNTPGAPRGRAYREAYLQIVDENGNLVGAPATTDLRFVTLYGEPTTTTSVTPLANGGFVVRWLGVIDGAVINRVQAYDPNADAVGTPFEIDAPTAFGTTRALVFALPDGGYVIGLQSANPANHNLLVYDNDGNPVGEVRMHDAGDGTGHSTFVLANRPNGDTLVENLAFGDTNNVDNITIQTIRFEGTVPVIEANQTGGTAEFLAAVLPVRVSIPDPDGSEIVQSIDVSGVPAGWTLSHPFATATLNAGVWTVSGPGIAHGGAIDLHLTAPFGTTGSGTLSVIAHTIDTDNGSTNQSFPASLDFAHLPVNNPPPFDFNADGKGDILFQNSNGTPAVWLLDGTGMMTMGPALANPGASWQAKASADFNGDGKADILWQNDNGTPAVWLMNGTGVLSTGAPLTNPGPSWKVIDAADFNADGKADILWQNDNGTPAVWLMDGTGAVSTGPALSNPGPSWHAKDAADFNGDGKADILWQNDNGTPAVWLMDGVNVLSTGPSLANPGPAWHAEAAGDFNGDGKADILWQNDNGTPAVWLMDGTSVLLTGPALSNPGPTWHVKEAIDANADGKTDILWQNDNGTPGVWLMDGTSVLQIGGGLTNPGVDWHIV